MVQKLNYYLKVSKFKFYCKYNKTSKIWEMLNENIDFNQIYFSKHDKKYPLINYLIIFKDIKLFKKIILRLINDDLIDCNYIHIFSDNVFELICKIKNFDEDIFNLILSKTKTLSHDYNYDYPLYNLALNKEFKKIDKLLKLGENPLKLNVNKLNCIDVTFAGGDKQLYAIFKDYIDSYFENKANYLPPTYLQLNHLLANLKNNSLRNYNLPLINKVNQTERLELFKIIIEYEQNFRKVYSPYPGKNAFLIACENGFYELVMFFISDLNVNVDEYRDWLGSTGLILAVENNDYDMVKLLVKSGADVNKGGYMDLKPLFSASKVKDKRIQKILIENGAK